MHVDRFHLEYSKSMYVCAALTITKPADDDRTDMCNRHVLISLLDCPVLSPLHLDIRVHN